MTGERFDSINEMLKELMAVAPPPHPGPHPPWSVDADPRDLIGFRKALDERNARINAWLAADRAYREWHAKYEDPPTPFRPIGRRWPWLVLHNLCVHPLMGLWQLVTLGLMDVPKWLERLHDWTYPKEADE